MKRCFLWAAIACAGMAGCGGDASEVAMTDDFRFDPQSVTVAAGNALTFSNTTTAPHSVTAYQDDLPDGADYFSSGGADSEVAARSDVASVLIAPGQEFELTLEEPGTYRYFCIPHEKQGMRGTIVVEP